MSQMIPHKWNVFESEREFDPDFFSSSPYHSASFLIATLLLCLDLGVGASIGLGFWSVMPSVMRTLYVLFLLGLPIVWLRMLRDHRQMRAWYAAAPREEIATYPVRMASHLITFAPYYLYLLVLLLLFCLLGVLRHLAPIST
jgi:hypothetical protein